MPQLAPPQVPFVPPQELARFQGEPALAAIRREFVPAVTTPAWRALVEEFLELKEPLTPYAYPRQQAWSFAASPGSGAHHAHIGGLALHVLQDLRNASALADAHEARGLPLDRSLLYAAILLHDCLKRFVYSLDADYALHKAEDPFIARHEDHHSWVLRELTERMTRRGPQHGTDADIILATAAMHGLDDVSLEGGVKPLAVVNHYLALGGTGLTMRAEDVRAEHTIGFLADSDWTWSGRAQQRTRQLAAVMAPRCGVSEGYMHLYLGSRFSFEHIDGLLLRMGPELTVAHLEERMQREGC